VTRNSRHRAIAAAAFLAAAPALAGCGAGFDAITAQPYAPTEATSVKVKGLDITQAFFLGPDSGGTLPAGASAPLYLYMVNTTGQPDQLVGVGVDPALGTAKVPAPVALPAGGKQAAVVGRPTPSIVIEQLKKPLRGGEEIQVQLQFEKAGIVPLRIPVVTRSREFATLPPAQGASAAPTPTPTPSAAAEHGEGDH
jgi:copper(I)-binding protein